MNKRGHVTNGIWLAIGLALVISPPVAISDPQSITISVSAITGSLLWMVKLLPPVVLGALLPDIDTEFGRHRKTLHNLPILALFVLYPIYFDNLHFVWVGIATHYLLDVVGSKRGIALFYPYEQEYNLPVGVAVSSDRADFVTLVISVLEVVLLGALHFFVLDLTTATLRPQVVALIPDALVQLL
jgi:membrane-bound metal-dependent hydrolase YbcI (DUF457 family)